MKDIKGYLINEDLFRYKNTEAKTLDLIGTDKQYWKVFADNEKSATRIFMTAMLYICTRHDTVEGNKGIKLDDLIDMALKYAKENYKTTYKD